jgi:hypothetical protein
LHRRSELDVRLPRADDLYLRRQEHRSEKLLQDGAQRLAEANAMAIANKQVAVATDNSEIGSYRTRARVFPALTESEPWLYEFVLSRFLHAKRYPLRSKTL